MGDPRDSGPAATAAPRRAAVVRIPAAAGDRLGRASAALIWAGAREMAASLGDVAPTSERFAPAWDALVGRWIDRGEGGAIRGIVTFSYVLQGHMLLRRGALVPQDQSLHEDLMLVTPASDGRGAECMYYDSEGYVVTYGATWTDDGRGLDLVSEPEAGAPSYRQAWRFDDPDTLRVAFDFAKAGGGDLLHHAEGLLHRARPERREHGVRSEDLTPSHRQRGVRSSDLTPVFRSPP
jgi:hypothetical protein